MKKKDKAKRAKRLNAFKESQRNSMLNMKKVEPSSRFIPAKDQYVPERPEKQWDKAWRGHSKSWYQKLIELNKNNFTDQLLSPWPERVSERLLSGFIGRRILLVGPEYSRAFEVTGIQAVKDLIELNAQRVKEEYINRIRASNYNWSDLFPDESQTDENQE